MQNKQSTDILKLFDEFKCSNFPYIDANGVYTWGFEYRSRFYTEYTYHKYFDSWQYYYDGIVHIERIIINFRKFCLPDRDLLEYQIKVAKHRQKFIRKLYKLGILDQGAFSLFLATRELEYPRLYSEILDLGKLVAKKRCTLMLSSQGEKCGYVLYLMSKPSAV